MWLAIMHSCEYLHGEDIVDLPHWDGGTVPAVAQMCRLGLPTGRVQPPVGPREAHFSGTHITRLRTAAAAIISAITIQMRNHAVLSVMASPHPHRRGHQGGEDRREHSRGDHHSRLPCITSSAATRVATIRTSAAARSGVIVPSTAQAWP